MKYMLDTNTCIFAIKNNGNVIKNLLKTREEDVCTSSIVFAELMYGVEKSSRKVRNYLALNKFISRIEVVEFDTAASLEYGIVRTRLETAGAPIGKMDMLIAAHAKSIGAIMVTNNRKEFDRVDGLYVEDWKQ